MKDENSSKTVKKWVNFADIRRLAAMSVSGLLELQWKDTRTGTSNSTAIALLHSRNVIRMTRT